MLAPACYHWRPVGLSGMLLRRVHGERTRLGTERRGVLQRGYAAEKQLNNTERLAV